MHIFLAWSGENSKKLAEILDKFLRQIDPRFDCWISNHDIRKGTDWHSKLKESLKKAEAVICCLTPDNYLSPWINFEGGVGAGRFDGPFCVTLDGKIADESPLSHYQFTQCTKKEIERLIAILSSSLPNRTKSVELSNSLWEEMNAELTNLRSDRNFNTEVRDEAMINIIKKLEILHKSQDFDAATLYIRDEMSPTRWEDYFLEGCVGLNDYAPMYGPVVDNDQRLVYSHDPNGIAEPHFINLTSAAPPSKIANRYEKFEHRENILARASIPYQPKIRKTVKAILYFNWRSAQIFDKAQKENLIKIAEDIFKQIDQLPKYSDTKLSLIAAELRARRYLDAFPRIGGNSKLETRRAQLVFRALDEFFKRAPVDLAMRLSNGNTQHPREAINKPELPADWKWVLTTGKPLYLQEGMGSSALFPIKNTSGGIGNHVCTGVILARAKQPEVIKKEMIRPLCSLGERFAVFFPS